MIDPDSTILTLMAVQHLSILTGQSSGSEIIVISYHFNEIIGRYKVADNQTELRWRNPVMGRTEFSGP